MMADQVQDSPEENAQPWEEFPKSLRTQGEGDAMESGCKSALCKLWYH